MKILRFFESLDGDFSTVKSYFSGFNTLKDICRISFDVRNENTFEITITYIGDTSSLITYSPDKDADNTNSLKNWINQKDDEKLIMETLKDIMREISDDDILYEFSIRRYTFGHNVKITTKLKNEYDLENWIYVNNQDEISHDKNRLKVLMNKKYDIDVTKSEIKHGYRDNHKYLYLEIYFNEKLSVDKKADILKWMKNIKIFVPNYEEEYIIFDSVYFGEYQNFIDCYIINMISDHKE
jgi:hypothetical protein